MVFGSQSRENRNQTSLEGISYFLEDPGFLVFAEGPPCRSGRYPFNIVFAEAEF